MDEIITRGIICLDDALGITYYLCEIDYVLRKDESFIWKFRPNYSVMSLLTPSDFQGIPGIELEAKKNEYIRDNITPVFISERTPSYNREDLWKLLEEVGLDYLNPLEWLLRTKTRYSGDKLYVIPNDLFEKEVRIENMNSLGLRSSIISRELLSLICSGITLLFEDMKIDDSNRKLIYTILYSLYSKEKNYIDKRRKKGIAAAAAKGNYRGRKKIDIDLLRLTEIMENYNKGQISEAEGMKLLSISRSTFERRYKEYLMRQ